MEGIRRTGRLISSYFSSQPSYLILFVTSRCNARCSMCFNWRNQDKAGERAELTLDEINRISKSFKNLLQLTVSGGEPFLRDDISDIVRCFYENSGARLITISTNGFFTDKIENTVSTILKECRSCLLNVSLSMDGIGQRHDSIRGLNGGFDNLIKTYERLSDARRSHANLYIKVTTVLSKYNTEEIEKILDYVGKNLKIDDHEVLLVRGDTRDPTAGDIPAGRYRELLKKIDEHAVKNLRERGYQFSRVFYALYKHMSQVVSETIEKKRIIYPCLAGRRLIEIYDDGSVRPCEMLAVIRPGMESSFGNIREFDYDIQRILRSYRAGRIMEDIKASRCSCSFECAILTNIAFNPLAYPRIIKNMIIPLDRRPL